MKIQKKVLLLVKPKNQPLSQYSEILNHFTPFFVIRSSGSDLYDAVKDTPDLEFLMIGLDQNKQKSQEFMEGKSWSFPVVHASFGLNNSLQSESIPTTLVVNKEGKIVFYHQGMSNFNTEEFKTFLRSQ